MPHVNAALNTTEYTITRSDISPVHQRLVPTRDLKIGRDLNICLGSDSNLRWL